MNIPDALVWIDLEMTGLDPDRDTIVEVACVVTDGNLVAVEAMHCVIHASDEVLAGMEPIVHNMHTSSGLFEEIRESPVDVPLAEQLLLEYVGRYAAARTAPLCGNSIGTDRRFISRHMPAFDEYLHYRNVDVSSIKELCRRWRPDLYETLPDKGNQHRALGDVYDSINELRFYREQIFGFTMPLPV